MPLNAKGTFEVTMIPEPPDDKAAGSTLGRLSLAKRFQGDLEGTSQGTMLTAMTDVPGSAGYVAIERVTGKLGGRSGSFVLQHHALMSGARRELELIVVPDSGTGQLVGLAGELAIEVIDGHHRYELHYNLPEGS